MAAASTGYRNGAKAGAKRLALMSALATPEAEFLSIFQNCTGVGPERLQKAIGGFLKTPKAKALKLKALEPEDMDFLKKVADRDAGQADGNISDQEAGFAFRVWIGFNQLRPKIEEIFDSLDDDGSGQLSAEELQGYLADLNDGCPVLKEEVEYVMNYVDTNGDGSLDKKELVFATSVWYCSVDESDDSAKEGAKTGGKRASVTQRMAGTGMRADLRVNVVGCCSLRNADSNAMQGVSDPYVTCKVVGSRKDAFRTPTIKDNLNPVWNHEATIRGYSVGDAIEFSVWDHDYLSGPDFLGHTVMDAAEFYPHGFDATRILMDAGDSKGKATIQLRIAPSSLEDNQSRSSFRSQDQSTNSKEPRLSTSSKEPRSIRSSTNSNDTCHTTASSATGQIRESAHDRISEEPLPLKIVHPPPVFSAEELAYPGPAGVKEPRLSGPDVSPLMAW